MGTVMAEAVAISTVSTWHDYGCDGRALEIEIRLRRAIRRAALHFSWLIEPILLKVIYIFIYLAQKPVSQLCTAVCHLYPN